MTTHEVVLPLFSPLVDGPTKRYRTIVADPPWAYNDKLGSGNSGFGAASASNGAESKYAVATSEDIAAIPVGDWAEDNAHLYLWTTNAFMDEAFDLVRAWGFQQKTILTWVKHRRDQAWLGMGFYYRNATEHILFCVRGSLPVERKDHSTVLDWEDDEDGAAFYAPRGRHSEKPAAFYDMVERMSPGPYLDVFARKQRFNWDTFGNEAFDFREHGIWNKETSAPLAQDAAPSSGRVAPLRTSVPVPEGEVEQGMG